ncbi:MAG TPA: hypothetical protein VFI91_01360 [Longimicrobiaceae bacterium]|nr:hypothetical protein [Longimicrobiaceae bacterium]
MPDPISRVREIYFVAVEKEQAVEAGIAAIREAEDLGILPEGSEDQGVLLAYHGAMITLRAKHAFWPPARLRHLNDGLAILDRAVEAHPTNPEIRYLRLLSCFYLPGILGRGESVQGDFAALANLLPAAIDDFPPDLYSMMVGFVLENGAVQKPERQLLEEALVSAADG